MKCTRIFAVTAAALAVVFASCSKEDGTKEVDLTKKTSVRLVIKDGMAQPGGRSVGAPVAAQTLAFENGMVYFTDATGAIYDAFKIVKSNPGEREVVMAVGEHVFNDITAASTHIHIVGNRANLPAAGNVNSIMVGVDAIYDNTNLGIANVTLYGTKDLDTTTDTENYTATVSVQPIAARIQIAKFTANADVEEYTVAGIFMNNFYNQVTVAGAKADADLFKLGEGDVALFAAGSAKYTNALDGIVYDATGWTAVGQEAQPADSKVWGYNLFAATNGEFPHIVVKFTGLKTDNGLTGTRFITITGFEDKDGDPVTFTGGKIYKILNFEFEESHLGTTPEAKKVKATVEVEYVNWTEEPVTPIQ